MKIAVLTTGTNNTAPLYRPLTRLGHDVTRIVYDEMPRLQQENDLCGLVAAAKPDLIYYIGALEAHHGQAKTVPTVDLLAEIGAIAPMVHICCDGGEPLWWEQLERYYDKARFQLQVNIDGLRTGPIGERGLTTLCCVDAAPFKNPAWQQRPIWCGFSGGLHFGRPEIIHPLLSCGQVVYHPRDGHGYDDFRDFMAKTRVAICVAYTGGGTGNMHVKARAGAEAPAAGCLVLETRGSPLQYWYRRGDHYIEYQGPEEAVAQIRWVKHNVVAAEAMANRMRDHMLANYTPAIVFSQILERLGLGAALRPERWTPYQHWTSSKVYVTPVPHLVQTIGGLNFVLYKGKYYRIPQSLGSLDITKAEHRARLGISEHASLEAAIAVQ